MIDRIVVWFRTHALTYTPLFFLILVFGLLHFSPIVRRQPPFPNPKGYLAAPFNAIHLKVGIKASPDQRILIDRIYANLYAASDSEVSIEQSEEKLNQTLDRLTADAYAKIRPLLRPEQIPFVERVLEEDKRYSPDVRRKWKTWNATTP